MTSSPLGIDPGTASTAKEIIQKLINPLLYQKPKLTGLAFIEELVKVINHSESAQPRGLSEQQIRQWNNFIEAANNLFVSWKLWKLGRTPSLQDIQRLTDSP